MQKFIMMCGLPGSGKSTYAKKHFVGENVVYLSSDELREELLGDENNQEENGKIFEEMERRTISALKAGKNVIYDACNTSYKKRSHLIKQINRYNVEKICVVVYADLADCFSRNLNRERKVPNEAIIKMLKGFYFPQYFEGWDEITIVGTIHTGDATGMLNELFFGTNGLVYQDHDNSHHKLSIGYHCLMCYASALFLGGDENLQLAALFHDIGKPFTKGFKDSRGNDCKEAHYYQHHLVSGYFVVPYLYSAETVQKDDLKDILEIIALIDYHMHPYFWEKDNNTKMQEKYRNLWGNDLYNKILLLHECDERAH